MTNRHESSAPESVGWRRALPSIASLLEDPAVMELSRDVPQPAVTQAVRAAVASVRDRKQGIPAPEEWIDLIRRELLSLLRPSLRPVLNATGIVLHTNLGRAPLAEAALAAISATAAGYSTLEYDLVSGDRGSRNSHCVALLRELTGAEDALVVNNCAAALVLALNTLAQSRDILISRGELIEIGGSFRIPDIMERSSAHLVETGTTNRTHVVDYRASITQRTAAIVKVHRSNFAQLGFIAEATLPELARLAGEFTLPLVFDLGSGLLISLERYGFPAEPTAGRAISEGATIVLMSGDKLLGGPQAGIIVGNADVIARMRANPLARAVRVDKLTLAALEATLNLYRSPEIAVERIPALAMLCAPLESIRARATSLTQTLQQRGRSARVVDSTGAVGAGAFPTFELASAAIALDGDAASLADRLREGDLPVIGRIQAGTLLLDLRSVPAQDDSLLATALVRALA